jgi:CRISPR-associated protein Csm2
MDKIIQAIRNKKSFKEVAIMEFAPSGKWADSIAASLGDKMKTTQLRKVFTAIKLIEQNVRGKKKDEPLDAPSLYMMMPHLAYAKARKLINDDFYNLMKEILGDGKSGKIQTVEDFLRFAEFMTAIVAYHKQYGK